MSTTSEGRALRKLLLLPLFLPPLLLLPLPRKRSERRAGAPVTSPHSAPPPPSPLFSSSPGKIWGASKTCSGSGMSVSKKRRMSGNCSTICGTGASRICTRGAKQTKSTVCSTVCRWTRACGPGGSARAGRPPPAGLFFVQAEELRLGRRSLPDLGRVVQLALLLPGPDLLLSSGEVVATTWPGPQRSTAAHVATMSAVVAAFDAEQLRSWAAS